MTPLSYSETLAAIGPGGQLSGVFTVPQETRQSVGVILLNAGSVSRVGPFRLNTDLARTIGQFGFPVLRFDLSGLGDSGHIAVDQSSDAETVALQAAMDEFERVHCINQFLIVGLCSGAYHSHRLAIIDQRIIGATFIDGLAFRTKRFYLQHYCTRFLRGRFWRNAIKRRWLARHQSGFSSPADPIDQTQFFYSELVGRNTAAEQVQQLISRGVRLLFVFTSGNDEVASENQFAEMFGVHPSEQIQVDYLAEAEHTFPLVANRLTLVKRIGDWVSANFAR